MKIIIVGAGIGGLAAYHALKKHLSDLPPGINSSIYVKIVESHTSPRTTTRTIGGGLGLAPNGLRAIASISPKAATYIQERGFPGALVTFRNSSGGRLGVYQNGRGERYGFDQLMVPRAVVHEALLLDLPEGDVEWGKRVHSLDAGEEDGKMELVYEDGTKEQADLVIGADGVRSVVRDSLFAGQYTAAYDGLTGVGGFLPLSSLPKLLQDSLKTEGVTMTFGKLGFFGYSLCSPPPEQLIHNVPAPFIQWWSIYECASPPDKHTVNVADIKAQLLERHAEWKSPHDSSEGAVYRTIIELGSRVTVSEETEANHEHGLDTSLLILPRYVTPRLPHWSNVSSTSKRAVQGRIVLLGDAAHAMPPDSGQGVSCAVEDAVAYALLLKHYLSQDSSSLPETSPLQRAATAYEKLRMPRVHRILDFAKHNGDAKKRVGWLGQKLRDLVMWVLCKLPETIGDSMFMYDAEKMVREYLSERQ
ncbi:hypothetical protein BDQ12DRAFT_735125 [Crucibulum laeve]|uniref:FAD-binding domain-containing protein n=1 Tax=Crucibulum laeve TaxID=68775 RepID=A0A5C3MCK9_9AGAR|nr:hypothetical protein BDQ12DRAFT_735125 [Crucibulum laeve]